MKRWGLAILLIVAAQGCGGGSGGPVDGGGGVASCMITRYIPSNGQTLMTCIEVAGASAPSVKENCPPATMDPPGVQVETEAQHADGPCSRVGLVGGCRVTLGQATTTFWYYQTTGGPPPDVSALCAMNGTTFVPS
jgi:hypothetical protein